MRTPRQNPARGIGTLIGNGWLHEAPRNVWPREWDIRGKSALRKCMFLPAPPFASDLLGPPSAQPRVSPATPRPSTPRTRTPPMPVPARVDARKHAREFAAVTPEEIYAKQQRAALYADEKAKLLRPDPRAKQAWFEDPVALGTLLIVLPPIGLAALWSSRRYSNDARWALTVMTALTMCLGAAIAITAFALR